MTAPIQIDGPYRRSPTARALAAWLVAALLAVVAFAVLVGLPFTAGALSVLLPR